MCAHITKAIESILAAGVVIAPVGYDGEIMVTCEYCDADELYFEGIGGDFGFNPIDDGEDNV